MQHITDPELRRRLALGLTVPPPWSRNRKRRFQERAVIVGMSLWLSGWICCLAYLALTGR
jgi:hypothetical protein